MTYHIETFSGVLGNVVNSSLTIGDYANIHQALRDAGVPQNERNELETIMDELPHATPEKKRNLVTRASSWIVRNADAIGKLSDSIRGWVAQYRDPTP